MASPVRTLTVNFVGKTDSLDKAFRRVNKGSALMSDKMRRNMRMGIGAIGGLGAAVGGFVALTKPMVDAASDIGESLSKNTVLFGASADRVAQWSETTSRGFGISRREALEAVGVFGALTHAMGMSGAEGSDMSVTMVELAADMASFNNASPEETLIALQAGLRGEAEPLRRYGVLLDAATLKQRALAEGIITNTTKALTPQEKALAAYAEILAQTEVQQGDFERTSDGLANKQRILSAVWGDLQADLGEKLLPAFQAVTNYLVDEFIPGVEKVFEMTGEEFGAFLVDEITKGFDDLQDPETFKPLSDILLAVGGSLGEALGNALWDGFVENLDPAFHRATVGNALGAVGNWIQNMVSELFGAEGDFVDPLPEFGPGTVVPPAGPMGPSPGSPAFGEIPDDTLPPWQGPFLPVGPDFVVPPAGPMGPSPGSPAFDIGPGGPLPEFGPGPAPATPEEEFHEAFKHLSDAELKAFFGMPAGPASRGQGITPGGPPSGAGVPAFVGTVVINTTAVTGEQVVSAMNDAVENLGLTLPARWSGITG